MVLRKKLHQLLSAWGFLLMWSVLFMPLDNACICCSCQKKAQEQSSKIQDTAVEQYRKGLMATPLTSMGRTPNSWHPLIAFAGHTTMLAFPNTSPPFPSQSRLKCGLTWRTCPMTLWGVTCCGSWKLCQWTTLVESSWWSLRPNPRPTLSAQHLCGARAMSRSRCGEEGPCAVLGSLWVTMGDEAPCCFWGKAGPVPWAPSGSIWKQVWNIQHLQNILFAI